MYIYLSCCDFFAFQCFRDLKLDNLLLISQEENSSIKIIDFGFARSFHQSSKAYNKEGLNLNKMAILFRATHHTQVLEMELNKRDIPYDYRGGLRFFERAHIKDVVAFLKIINNINDEISWLRVLNMQVGIGSVTADNIVNKIRETGVKNLKEVLDLNIGDSLGIKARIGWDNLAKILQAIVNTKAEHTSDIIQAILKSDYRDYLISQLHYQM